MTDENASLESIADSQTMPEPMEHVLEQPENEPEKKNGPVDRMGCYFNPELHQTDDSGKPLLTKTGKLKRKTRIKKEVRENMSDPVKQQEQLKAAQNHAAMGVCAASAFTQAGVVIFGDEWNPENDEEAIQLSNAFKTYFEAKGMDDISPGWALAIGIGGYALKRASKPKTKSKMQRVKDWIGSKYLGWRAKRNGSQPDNRTDGNGENESGKETGKPFEGKGGSTSTVS